LFKNNPSKPNSVNSLLLPTKFNRKMSFVLLLFVLSALAFQVFPVALGADFKKDTSNASMLIATLVLTQTLMLWLATLVGQRFLYLTEEYRNTIVFIGFFLVGMRVAMESFAVRKGERTFNADNNQNIFLENGPLMPTIIRTFFWHRWHNLSILFWQDLCFTFSISARVNY